MVSSITACWSRFYNSLLPPITTLSPSGAESRRFYATARDILKISDDGRKQPYPSSHRRHASIGFESCRCQ